MAAERKGVFERGWTRDRGRTMTLPMADRRQAPPATNPREARLKAALKANIARRKARARGLEQPGEPPQDDAPQDTPEEE